MLKKTFLIFSLILLVLTGCELNKDTIEPEETSGTVTLTVTSPTRSILPSYPEIKGYKVTLGGSEQTYNKSFSNEEVLTIENVLIGTYTATVQAYSDASLEVEVAKGSATLQVKPNVDNTTTISLDWLEEGTGSFSVTIDWADLTNRNNLIAEAVENGNLGFVAWDPEKNEAFNNASIQWVEDTAATSYTYTQTGIPTSSTSRSKNISFRAYTKINGEAQAIAEAFNATVTILPNLISVPDGSESFSFDDTNIVYYMKNVTGVTAKLNDDNSAENIDISWQYPVLSDGTYILTVWITNNNLNSVVVGDKQTFTYTVKDRTVTSGQTSTIFTGLNPSYFYTVHFLNESDKSTMIYTRSAESTPIKDVRTKVKVKSIGFESDFETEYVMGATKLVNAVIAPDDATIKEYTVAVTEGATVDDKTLSFPSSGDYTITLTSLDEHAISKTAEKTVTVKLAVPQNFTLEKTDGGVKLDWSGVAGAAEYSIEKVYNAKTDTITTTDTTYTDSNVYTGVTYTYRIKAVRNDNSKFDSEYTSTLEAEIPNVTVTVTLPEDVERINRSSIISDAIGNEYVTDTKTIEVNIKNAISSSYTFSWYLNGVKVGEDNAKSIKINTSTKGLNITATESTNTLQLLVTKGDYTYSASSALHYIDVDPGAVTISGESSIKGRDTTVSLKATTNNPNAVIIWSSSDTSVVTVSDSGVVTAVNDGKATITATVAATGASDTFEVTSYVSELSFSNVPTTFLIFARNDQYVSVTNSTYASLNLASYLTGKDGGKGVYEWTSSNTGVATVSADGTVTPRGSGTATIKVVKDSAPHAEYVITVYNLDIQKDGSSILNDNKQKIEYKESITVSLTGGDASKMSVKWCINGDINKTKIKTGSAINELEVQNSDDFTAKVYRPYANYDNPNIYACVRLKGTENKTENIIATLYFKVTH